MDKIIDAAVKEYLQVVHRADASETAGRHAAVRGLMVRLGLYPQFCEALANVPGDTDPVAISAREALQQEGVLNEAAADPQPSSDDLDAALRKMETELNDARGALKSVSAERDQALYFLHHADFTAAGIPYPSDGRRYCTETNLDRLAAAKRLAKIGLVTVENSPAGPVIAWAAGRGGAIPIDEILQPAA